MALSISGSVVMAEIMAFHDRLIKAALRVDISGMDVYHTVNTNIGNNCLEYSLDKRVVRAGVSHTDMVLGYEVAGQLVLESTFPQREMDAQVNGALRWLLGMPISLDQLPQEVVRIASPEDGKDYSSVGLVVQINSSYEVSKLYEEIKEKGWTYQQDMGGPLKMVGSIAKQQLWVMPQIHTINGVKVLYIQPTSAFVQWDMIEEWVKQRVPEGTPMLNDPQCMLTEIRDIADSKKKVA